ncbi:MAG: EamA family transporter [Opitutaceae bacterium]
MYYLVIVSLIWAFSFGLIGNALAGLDSFFVASVRLGLAALVFLPFLRLTVVPAGQHLRLIGCGAIQFGLMYVTYISAFNYIPSHLVALFSVFTPLYVVLIHDLRQRRWSLRTLAAAGLSVLGAAVIKAKAGESDTLWIGFALMQIAGLSFAFGQVYYRDWKRRFPEVENHKIFALLYLGGALLAITVSTVKTDWSTLSVTAAQWPVLLYLGVIASGAGFFLWNKGAAVSRPGTLAAFNNAVVPLAMFASLFIFGEIGEISTVQVLRLIGGGALIAVAVWLAERSHTTE